MLSTSSSTSGLARLAVSGIENAPTLAPLADQDNGELVITSFWNDLLEGGIADQNEAQRFFGQVAGGEGGEGACQLAQMTIQSLSPLFQATTSSCYMTGMAETATSEIVTPLGDNQALSDYDTLFDEAGRIVMVETTNEDFDGDGNVDENGGERIFIRIDSNNASSYQHTLWFCDGKSASSPVRGYEVTTVNKSTGAFTMTTKNNREEESRDSTDFVSVSAFLTASGGTVAFDTTKDRLITSNYTASGGGRTEGFKGRVTIDGNNRIFTKAWFSGTETFESNTYVRNDKQHAVANFSGSGTAVKFTEGAFNGRGQFYNQTDTAAAEDVHEYEGAAEWVNSFYQAVTSGSLYDLAAAFDFSTDDFFSTAPTTPDLSDLLQFNCASSQADYRVAMDFQSQTVSQISAECESDFNHSGFCWGGEIETARRQAYGAFFPDD